MSEFSQLYGGLKRLIKERRAEFKILESMAEAVEALPQLESALEQLEKRKNVALAEATTAEVRRGVIQEELTDEEFKSERTLKDLHERGDAAVALFEKELRDRQAVHGNELQGLNEKFEKDKREVNEKLSVVTAELNGARSTFETNLKRLKGLEAKAVAALKDAEDKYAAFKASV